MSHEIIMPALGMAQDTGLIVAWHKNSGDPVAIGDILMEVETDKSTMEVEAQAQGYLTNVAAAAGDNVPVGNVIALISDVSTDNEFMPVIAHVAESKPIVEDVSVAENPGDDQSIILPDKSEPTIAAEHGRILASPKAKRLAQEQGLDLKRLADLGHAQPYHVSDVQILRALPRESAVPTAMADIAHSHHISARVTTREFDIFLIRMKAEGGIELDPHHVLAGFAAASLRQVADTDGELSVDIGKLSGSLTRFVDPDIQRMSTLQGTIGTGNATLVIKDATDSFITGIRIGGETVPTLTIVRRKKAFEFSLEFSQGQIGNDQSVGFMTGLCERLNDPLRHLV